MYVLDEAEHIEKAILSAINFVDEVVVWDTGSTDGTPDIVEMYADRLYHLKVPEVAVHFGEMETIIAHLAKCDWVLRLDGDEELGGAGVLPELLTQPQFSAWGLARFRWADMGRKVQLELEAFPDWQYRLFLNDGRSRFVDPLHPHFETPHEIGRTQIPWIDHFVDPLHLNNPKRLARRSRLYTRLAVEAGKEPEGSDEAMRLAEGVVPHG